MALFQPQTDRRHILESFLIALSFASPFEPKDAQSVVSGFVHNEQFYVSNQKVRGWLYKQNGLLFLSEKAKQLVKSRPFEIVVNKKEVNRLIQHEVLVVRSLFLCLLHLNFTDIKQIKKQKYYENLYIPDLTIITKTNTLFIEVDTGNQPIKTLEAKISGFQASKRGEATLIYFTNSDKNYSHFTCNPNVQFVYLPSSTLLQDMQNLIAANISNVALYSLPNSTDAGLDLDKETNLFPYSSSQKALYKVAPNVLVFDPSLVSQIDDTDIPVNSEAEYKKRREEIIKLVYQDDEF
jgi:hypothetical protein